MRTFKIQWGHSGSYGCEWNSAQQASRYASILWGEETAETASEAAQRAIAATAKEGGESPDLYDWYEDSAGDIHMIRCVGCGEDESE